MHCLVHTGTYVHISETYLCSQECCDLSSRAGESQTTLSNPIQQATSQYTSDTREFASWKY